MLEFIKSGDSCGGPWWCSISSNLVLEFVKSGARFRRIWCSISSNLVLLVVVLGGARFRQIWCYRIRQIWCSISSNLVLDFAKSGARIRQIWCSISPNLVLNFSGWCSISQSPVVGLVPERAKRRHTRAKIVLCLNLPTTENFHEFSCLTLYHYFFGASTETTRTPTFGA